MDFIFGSKVRDSEQYAGLQALHNMSTHCWALVSILCVGRSGSGGEWRLCTEQTIKLHTTACHCIVCRGCSYVGGWAWGLLLTRYCGLITVSAPWVGWDACTSNKLHSVKPSVGYCSLTHLNRRDAVIFRRLRIGHTRLTHQYRLSKEKPPQCPSCICALTVMKEYQELTPLSSLCTFLPPS